VFSSLWLRDVESNLIKLQLSIDNTHTRIECMNASHHHVCVGLRASLSNLISTSSCVCQGICVHNPNGENGIEDEQSKRSINNWEFDYSAI
jgi:hypothetical protein